MVSDLVKNYCILLKVVVTKKLSQASLVLHRFQLNVQYLEVSLICTNGRPDTVIQFSVPIKVLYFLRLSVLMFTSSVTLGEGVVLSSWCLNECCFLSEI